jgi:hypothetical protein
LLSPLMLSPIVMGFRLRAVDEREIFKMFITRGQKDQNYFILFYKKNCWDVGYMLPDSI